MNEKIIVDDKYSFELTCTPKTRAEKCQHLAKSRAEKCQWQVLTDCIIENYQIFAFCEEFKRMQVIEN